VREFPTVANLTEQTLAIYVRRRLGEVRAKSVRSELGALRRFVAWLAETDRIKRAPTVPRVKAGATGTPFKHRRRVRAPELSPEEVDRFLAALPVTSDKGFWVRDRLVVAFETTLRTATLERIRAPENYAAGAETLILTDSDDKESYGRELPLTQRARDALSRCCPAEGIIFGPRSGLYKHVRKAAALALPAHKAAILCAQHLRSAGITHWLEVTANLPGVQELAGHKRAATTSLYSRRSTRAARAVIEAADRVAGTRAGTPAAAAKKPA